jgi:protein-S-isoprenylcysteine O-methyltransferase Ste14
MSPTLRHLRAVLALPFVVTVLVPGWLAYRDRTPLVLATAAPALLLQCLGALLLGTGLVWFAGSLRRFASDGHGTLAPWDPPRELVVTGLYRRVRNPMITGVALVLLGEAALLRSPAQLTWAVAFIGLNAVLIPLYEEPRLQRRFGEPYREYCRHVPRMFPRWRPWMPAPSSTTQTETPSAMPARRD